MTTMPHAYVKALVGKKDPVLRQILEQSLLGARMPPIQVDDNAGRLLQMITMLKRPRKVLEIGTLFGYSTIHIARGLPADGVVTTLELDPVAAGIAAENFKRAGVSERVDLVVGDALPYLRSATPECYDMIFIDADKSSYLEYLKLCYPLLTAGGVILADDAFGWGHLTAAAPIDDPELDAQVRGIRAYNQIAAASQRLMTAFIGTENGLIVSVKTSGRP